ncbi:MAG: hypothetical protein K1X53_16630 [Candidatus Sumerlaeaceae bacterium]|nr:hypothetical protein [Candidatus Sumerlaeaceae bacterium]
MAAASLLLAALILKGNPAMAESPLQSSRQLVVVTTADWDAIGGQMQRFERDTPGSDWRTAGSAIRVVVGKRGLGWGAGLHDGSVSTEPLKREGDGKGPAGMFRLSRAFGLAPASEMGWVRLPYQQLTSSTECVDDSASRHYNQIVDREGISSPDWRSSEKMRAIGDQYRLGVVVEHNCSACKPGAGSCIFLHIWEGETTGTSGCTAMALTDMEVVMRWLDPVANPILVQLPEADFMRLRKKWELPILRPDR